MHGMELTQPTEAKKAVELFPVDAQYLALIALNQKLQLCARNSSDILYKYPWIQESGALRHELAKHVDITSLNTSEISGNKHGIVNLLKQFRVQATASIPQNNPTPVLEVVVLLLQKIPH